LFCIKSPFLVTILVIKQEVNGSLLRHQGGLLYKTHLTATVFKDFSSCYQHFTSQTAKSPDQAFVYVDASGVKLLTSVVDDRHASGDGIFALSVAQDGFVEMLTLHEAG
jgi:hypothetical protein